MVAIDFKALDKIIDETIQAIEKGKQQVFDIAEMARKEYNRVSAELEALRKETLAIINQVDLVSRKERLARLRLLEVSRDFEIYSEEDIKAAYEVAKNLQVELSVLREQEKNARQKRDDLERTLKNLKMTVEKAESLVSQVGVVMGYLSGNLKDLTVQLEGLQHRQQLAIRIIKAQEEERKRVAREIHDGPAQTMANVVLRAEICEKLFEIDQKKVLMELKGLKEAVRTSLQDVRRIIFDLRPMVLDDLGLIPTLRRYAADFQERSGIITEFTLIGRERRFHPAVEVALFRMVQEALNNVQKHADSREVKIMAEIAKERVSIVIRDDGKGFDLRTVLSDRSRESFGLESLRERVELLEGTMNIDTAPGKGTKLYISIPITDEKGSGLCGNDQSVAGR